MESDLWVAGSMNVPQSSEDIDIVTFLLAASKNCLKQSLLSGWWDVSMSKVLVAKRDSLSLIPRTYMVDGEN